MTRFRILILALVLSIPSAAQAAMRFVDDNSPNSPGTGTAADPYRTFDSAYAASSNGDEIRVAAGTYYENNFSINKSLTIRGGYPGYAQAGTWSTASQNTTAYQTIFRPSANWYGVFYVWAPNVWLDGVRLYSIYGWQYILYASGATGLKITNSYFEGLSYTYSYGLYLNNIAGLVLQNNVFVGNYASYYLLQVNYSSGDVSGNVFRSYYYGSYFYYSPNLDIHHNDFYNLNYYWSTIVQLCGATFQNNLLQSTPYYVGYALELSDCGYANTVVSNNITGFYSPFSIYDPNAVFAGNLIWNNSSPGNVNVSQAAGMYPYLNAQSNGPLVSGNCWQGLPYGMPGASTPQAGKYLVTAAQGAQRWFDSQAEAEAVLGVTFSQTAQTNDNSLLGSAPADPHGQGCGSVGINGTVSVAPTSRLTAYVGSSNRDLPELDVAPGVTFTLDGSKSSGFPLPLTWFTFAQVSGPAAVTLATTGDPAKRTASASVAGTYIFSVVLRMSAPSIVTGNTATVTVFVAAKNFRLLAPNGTQKGVFNYLQDAVIAAQRGDTVQLPAGRFTAGPDYAGEVTVYGKEGVTIRGAGKGVNGSLFLHDCASALDIEYSRGVVVRDVAFEQMTADCYNASVYVDESDGITIDSIRVTAKRADPFNANGVEFNYANGVIRNSEFEYLQTGVYLSGCGLVDVTNNAFTALSEEGVSVSLDCGYDRTNITGNTFDMKMAGWAAIYVDQIYGLSTQSRIAGNVMRNLGQDALYVEDIGYTAYPIIIENNTMSNDRDWIWQGGYGIEIYWAQVLFRQNTVWGFEHSGMYISDYDEMEVGAEKNIFANLGGFGIENYNSTCDYYDENCVPLTWAKGNLVYNTGMGSYYNVRLLDAGYSVDPAFADGDAGNFALTASSPVDELGLVNGLVPPLPGPTGLKAEALPGAVRLIFDEVPGATAYTVLWGEEPENYPQSKDVGLERTATIANLGDKLYYFVVKARNAAGDGFASAAVSAKPLGTAGLSNVTVDGVEPGRIFVGSQAEILVVGSGFVEGLKVYAGSTTMEVVKVEANLVTVKAPKTLKAGIYPVAVVNPDLARGVLHEGLTVSSRSVDDGDGGCSTAGKAGLGSVLWLVVPLVWIALRRRRRAD